MATHANLWFESCPTRRDVSVGLIKNVDTLIIGGGLAGITLLYHLVNSGMINTYLVEESSIGFHASGRNAGQLLLRGSTLFHQNPIGAEYLNFISENNRRFLNGLRTLDFDKDLHESGGLRVATTNEEFELLKAESDFIRTNKGIDCPVLTRENLTVLLRTDKFCGGIFVPNESHYNPYKVVNGIRDSLEKNGDRVLTNTQVESVVTNDDGSTLVTIRNRGIIRAKQVVYCTGAYTSRLLPELKNVLIPFREQYIASEYLDTEIAKTMPIMSVSFNDGRERLRMYNTRVIFSGMRHSVRGQQDGLLNDGEISPALYDKLRNFVLDSFPFLKPIKFSHVWSSVFCSTPDNMPLIGPLNRPNQYIMAGFGTYDSSHVVLGSIMIKDYIRGKTSNLFHPGRFNV